jgi:hypothetical protein
MPMSVANADPVPLTTMLNLRRRPVPKDYHT